MKFLNKLFLFWMISLAISLLTEAYFQIYLGMIGFGIISSIFLSVILMFDYIEYCRRNK